ncbi:MAG TPA: primosomal protein N' [Gemmatimonadaceae bacterium]|nr:primosomal protein N' [Gemmatimonadaceae bacterium]
MLISVALPLPLFREFTYAVPDALVPRAGVGARVVVPVRGRRAIGVVVGIAQPKAGIVAKEILAAPDDAPVLDASLLDLARWMSDYYVAPLGLVLRTMLPAALLAVDAPRPTQKERRVARLARDLPSLLEREATFKRAPKQRAVYEMLESLGGRAPVEHLVAQLGASPSAIAALGKRGIVAFDQEVVVRDPFLARPAPPAAAHQPTPAQQAAVHALGQAGGGESFVLHGVTGSGKTLVYLEFLRRVVDERGQTAIVLVPEIALTPQTVDRFRAVFGDRIAVLHSGLSDGERYDAWLALARGEKRIAVGARSAVFAPLANLGAIIVDEEHEATYKQSETPRYHAREVALVRSRRDGAVVVLGSATPSLESWHNAQRGRHHLLRLPDRVGGGVLPAVELVDMRRPDPMTHPKRLTPDEYALRYVLSEPLERKLGERLARGEQSILLLNRRGYASFVQCEACGDVAACPNCNVSLTYHRVPERLVCHYCQYAEPMRSACPRCGGLVLRGRGLGTQQVEQLLGEHYPSARIARMDMDTTSGKWAHANILDRVGRGEVDILLGTQMIAKGLDFPNVTLVGVVDADVGINMPDFRASERCFQLVSQVAGRAGRGHKRGEVIVQTRVPQHHALQCAAAHDYDGFVARELAARQSPPYPPFSRLANVIVSGWSEHATMELAQSAGAWLHALVARREPGAMSIIGPAPCPVDRVKKRWRWHLLLRAQDAAPLTRVSRYFALRFPVPSNYGLRVTVDRDPVSLL